MTDLEFAAEFSKRVHRGQVDKAGEDYYKHPESVASFCDTDEEKIVAYLHDTVEDTDTTIDMIRDMFGEKIAEGVFYISHPKGLPYMEQIKRLAKNDLARRVKLADLRHNMDLSRLPVIRESDLIRNEKYKKAREYLLAYK